MDKVDLTQGTGLSEELFREMFGFDLTETNVTTAESGDGQLLVEKKLKRGSPRLKKCLCQPSNGRKCQIKCWNRIHGVECTETCNEANGVCQNRGMANREVKNLRLISRGDAGFGVATRQFIAKGEYITDYTGVVYSALSNPHHLTTHYAAAFAENLKSKPDKSAVIEATDKGNISRFIQHSDSPNCYGITKRVDDTLRLGIFALHNISPCAELTMSYGADYRQLGVEICRCCNLESCPDVFHNLNKHRPIVQSSSQMEANVNESFLPIKTDSLESSQIEVLHSVDQRDNQLIVKIPLAKLRRGKADAF